MIKKYDEKLKAWILENLQRHREFMLKLYALHQEKKEELCSRNDLLDFKRAYYHRHANFNIEVPEGFPWDEEIRIQDFNFSSLPTSGYGEHDRAPLLPLEFVCITNLKEYEKAREEEHDKQTHGKCAGGKIKNKSENVLATLYINGLPNMKEWEKDAICDWLQRTKKEIKKYPRHYSKKARFRFIQTNFQEKCLTKRKVRLK